MRKQLRFSPCCTGRSKTIASNCRLELGRCAASARNFWVRRPHRLQPACRVWDGRAVSWHLLGLRLAALPPPELGCDSRRNRRSTISGSVGSSGSQKSFRAFGFRHRRFGASLDALICLRSHAVSQPNSRAQGERLTSELIPQINLDQRTRDGFGYRCRGSGMNPADRSVDLLVNPRGRRSAL